MCDTNSTTGIILNMCALVVTCITSCHCVSKFSSLCCKIVVSSDGKTEIQQSPTAAAIVKKISPRKSDLPL